MFSKNVSCLRKFVGSISFILFKTRMTMNNRAFK